MTSPSIGWSMPKATACRAWSSTASATRWWCRSPPPAWKALLVPLKMALEEVLSPATIILRNDAPARALEGLELMCAAEKGEAGRIAVEENGARYFADLGQGQKTGWYYDQRDNRAFIAALAKGKTRAGRLFLYRRLRHPGGQGGREGSGLPG